MVIDKVMDVMDCVMAETIGSDRCDGNDGKNKKLSENNDNVEILVECNTPNESQELKNDGEGRAGSPRLSNRHVDSVEEFLKMPSHSSQNKAESHTVVGVTDTLVHPSLSINSPITVGDKVTIFDCPGHWSWASPFTVEAIEGEMVKLEMIEELVGIGRLKKWSK